MYLLIDSFYPRSYINISFNWISNFSRIWWILSFTVPPKELSKEVENPPNHILLPTLIPNVGTCQVSRHFVSMWLLVGYIAPVAAMYLVRKKFCSLGWARFPGPSPGSEKPHYSVAEALGVKIQQVLLFPLPKYKIQFINFMGWELLFCSLR